MRKLIDWRLWLSVAFTVAVVFVVYAGVVNIESNADLVRTLETRDRKIDELHTVIERQNKRLLNNEKATVILAYYVIGLRNEIEGFGGEVQTPLPALSNSPPPQPTPTPCTKKVVQACR